MGSGEALRSFLRARDVPCPACGYNLRGLPGDRCPECNELLDLRVGLVHPKLAWFITALVGLAAGAGFSGLLLLYYVWRVVPTSRRLMPEFLWTTLVGVALEGGLLAVLVLRRRSLSRWAIAVRWVVAAACWALTAANFATFSVLID